MQFPAPLRLADAAALLGCAFEGPEDHLILGLNEIHRVQPGDVTFSDVRKYFKKAIESPATTLLLNERTPLPPGKALLLSDDPFRDFNRLAAHYRPAPNLAAATGTEGASIHPTARLGHNVVVGPGSVLAEAVVLGHNVVVGANVRIGAGTIIHPNVVIYDHTEIGRGCEVFSGAIIGADAFYYKKRDWGRERMHSCGNVVLEDYVEVGANTTIDRGVSHETRIGEHTKLDNLVQVGHDVRIGKRCVVAAQVGIAGVSTVGDDAILWGQSGLATEAHVGNRTVVMGQSGIMGTAEDGKTYLGSPAMEAKRSWRVQVILAQLAERWPELQTLLDAEEGA
jgi:UDP-3-O-[3-hydroxymyristoyl] glucosamine N-acyltransferase